MWEIIVVTVVMALGTDPALAQETDPVAPGARLLSTIDVKNFGAETLRIGDLDGDGGPDLLFIQNIFGTREITCLTATTIHGEVLWQSGTPSLGNGRIYSDLPVQVYDWDRDGWNEALYVRQAKYVEPPYDGTSPRERATRYEGEAQMIVLCGRTGKEKGSFSLPAPADDSFLIADLSGRGRREDLIVKDRYWNMWGIAHDGGMLWHYEGSVGHYPAIADVDDDGKDEVFTGFALIDHDGTILFQNDAGNAHADATWILRAPDHTWRLLFGNGGIHCLAPDGKEYWSHPLGEAQHVIAGRFRTDSPVQLAVVDRTPIPHHRDEHAWGILYMYDLDGKELWNIKQPPGAWAIATTPVNWFGTDPPSGILVYGMGKGLPAVIWNGKGNVAETLPMSFIADRNDTDQQIDYYGLAADVWGDSRDEVLLFGSRGACIYTNARPAEIPTLYNENLYPGM